MSEKKLAVVYHADAVPLWGGECRDVYQRLFAQLCENAEKFGYEILHLTLPGHPVWGHVGFAPDLGLKKENVILNREILFQYLLRDCLLGNDLEIAFIEPDARFVRPIPPLPEDCDGAFLYRPNDGVAMTPSFRILRPRMHRIQQEFIDGIHASGRLDWHGDSTSFNAAYERMGRPKLGNFEYLGGRFEMRPYDLYTSKGHPSAILTHFKYKSKGILIGESL